LFGWDSIGSDEESKSRANVHVVAHALAATFPLFCVILEGKAGVPSRLQRAFPALEQLPAEIEMHGTQMHRPFIRAGILRAK
jgi:hypothetical protein